MAAPVMGCARDDSAGDGGGEHGQQGTACHVPGLDELAAEWMRVGTLLNLPGG